MPRSVSLIVFWTFLAALLVVGLLRGSGPSWAEVEERIRNEFPKARQLSSSELAAWLADAKREPPLLLDVRRAEEYAISHLEGAVRIDPGSKMPELPTGVTFETPIVVYCSVGYRSSALAEHLEALGFSRVASLEGSIFQWANEGYPLVRGQEPVEVVHPFDRHWGRLLDTRLHPADLP